MRSMAVFTILAINIIIQSTILQHFRIFDVLPNTALILVVIFSVLWGRNNGAIIGLLAGLAQDILMGSAIGVNGLIYFFIALAIGTIENSILKDSNITPIFFTTLSTLAYYFGFMAVMYVSNTQFNFIQVFKDIVVLETLYNGFLSVVLYKLIYNLFKHPNLKLRVR